MNFVLFDKLVESCFRIEATLLKKEADMWLHYTKQESRDVNKELQVFFDLLEQNVNS